MSLPNSILYNESRYSFIFTINFTRYFLSAAVPQSSKIRPTFSERCGEKISNLVIKYTHKQCQKKIFFVPNFIDCLQFK